jgi:outer membrane protein assembly factor BamB
MAAALGAPPIRGQDQSVVTYHGHADRSGHYVVPGLTWDRAHTVHLDPRFHGEVAGHVYAQPLYWQPASPGHTPALLIVATEDDLVYALNAETGAVVWKQSLGRPVRRSALPCGNIDPLGITGTPAIDARSGTVYLDAMVADSGSRGPQHLVFALSLRDGTVVPGWPVNVGDALKAKGLRFTPEEQGERSALLVQGDYVYVPYGGHTGDCGQYHGWVVGVALHHPATVVAWSTRALLGGIWTPAGIVSDDQSLYVATGNTRGAAAWGDGEAIIRLTPDLHTSGQPRDFFAPSDWQALDGRDADLGGVAPLLVTLGQSDRPPSVIVALGKDGKAYLADRTNLGGIGGQLASQTVADGQIITAPATWSSTDGAFVAFPARGARCPARSRGNGLVGLEIVAGARPTIQTAWCARLDGAGAPIVTTSDDHSDPIVWVTGAGGDDLLHGYRGDTGEVLFTSGQADAMQGLRRFGTILAAGRRLYIAADGRIYAFTL